MRGALEGSGESARERIAKYLRKSGSTDLKEIQSVCQRLHERGTAILGRNSRIGLEGIAE